MGPSPVSTFSLSTVLYYGLGAVSSLAEHVRGIAASSVLLVTDAGVVRAGITERIRELLISANIAVTVFDQVEANPSITTMDRAGATAREGKCSCVVGVGGGSVLDAAKGAALVSTHGGSLAQFVGIDKVPGPSMPVLAIPTTAGTGSEVSWHISVTDERSHRKVTVRSRWCVPQTAILDPELLASLPAPVAAATGMDALAHAVESFLGHQAWTFTEALAIEAIRLIGANLRPFVAHRGNVAAGGQMLVAATLAGSIISYARTGLVHSMARPLGARYDIPHGLATAVLLPWVMEFNAPAAPEECRRVAEALGEAVNTMPVNRTAKHAAAALRELARDVGIPERLRDVGVKEDALEVMAKEALDPQATTINARPATEEDIRRVYEAAF